VNGWYRIEARHGKTPRLHYFIEDHVRSVCNVWHISIVAVRNVEKVYDTPLESERCPRCQAGLIANVRRLNEANRRA
jgi:hypothetical protein